MFEYGFGRCGICKCMTCKYSAELLQPFFVIIKMKKVLLSFICFTWLKEWRLDCFKPINTTVLSKFGKLFDYTVYRFKLSAILSLHRLEFSQLHKSWLQHQNSIWPVSFFKSLKGLAHYSFSSVTFWTDYFQKNNHIKFCKLLQSMSLSRAYVHCLKPVCIFLIRFSHRFFARKNNEFLSL